MCNQALYVKLFVLTGCFLLGCGKSSQSDGQAFSSCLAGMSLRTRQDVINTRGKCEEAVRFLQQNSYEDGLRNIQSLLECFRRMDFDERTYLSRSESFSHYFQLVKSVRQGMSMRRDILENVWNFQLEALDRINHEIDRCRLEPLGGTLNVSASFGPFQTQRMYLENLCFKRFQYMRDGFETGAFVVYFHELGPSHQREWIRRLETVAKRHVVIWDPKNQMIELPTYSQEIIDEHSDMCIQPGVSDDIEQLGGGHRMKLQKVRHTPLGDTPR